VIIAGGFLAIGAAADTFLGEKYIRQNAKT
jgi:hypothetical protein